MLHDDFDRDFDRQFSLVRKAAVVAFVVQGVIGISVLVFVGWVVVKLLQHFGVV